MSVFNRKEGDELDSEFDAILKYSKDIDQEIELGVKTEKRRKEISKLVFNNKNRIIKLEKRRQELYDIKTKQIRKVLSITVGTLLASDMLNFILFFLTRNRTDLSFEFYLINIPTVIYTAWFTLRFVLDKDSAGWLPIFGIINSLSLFIVTFSNLYWLQGTTANWNMALSHIDAIFVTMGILTTAGTGNILPISELARGIELLQMILVFIVFTPLIVLIINRFWDGHNLEASKLEPNNQTKD